MTEQTQTEPQPQRETQPRTETSAAGPERTPTAQPPADPAPAVAATGAPEGAATAGTAGTAEAPAQAAPKDRRVLRAVLRWTAVAVVFAAVGAGTAYGITGMDRTDVPGLATESDGRWPYPEITRPPLPSGRPGPFSPENLADAHYADLRALLLPAPTGAAEDTALRGTGGWLAKKDFLSLYASKKDQDKVSQVLTDRGLRHVAARGWTTADGTRTRVYLLQFDTGRVAHEVYGQLAGFPEPKYAARGGEATEFDDTFPTDAEVGGGIDRSAYTEVKPYGAEQMRQAYVDAGDVLAVIVQSRKGGAAAVPFQQTVTLQSQLLA
ncbi:hypothetical protein [Streptomyces sp. NPDC003697]